MIHQKPSCRWWHFAFYSFICVLLLGVPGCSSESDSSRSDSFYHESSHDISSLDAPRFASSSEEPLENRMPSPLETARSVPPSMQLEHPPAMNFPATSHSLRALPVAPATAPQESYSPSNRVEMAPSIGSTTPAYEMPNDRVQNDDGFATVQVFYATDRNRSPVALSDYRLTGQKPVFIGLTGFALLLFAVAAMSLLRGQSRTGNLALLGGSVFGCLAAAMMAVGAANVEKHGVTYTSERGQLVRGVCEVTVPDTHQRGLVERPSLLRFEVREDQQKHVVLTSAIELGKTDFQIRLSEMISESPGRDLLVFIHGYNVDFESAVLRTAQIAVDLPFEGVPVCYSWPSQASLLGYTVDENNSEWTIYHLKQFLLELALESGADSINVVAHSMGNRAMTAAMQQIRWELDRADPESPPLFDRIVLAAPDVDADRFRRDLAPALLDLSNQVTLYASSDDQALIASKKVHGYPRAGESGMNIVVVPGVETIDVSGIDLSLLGHSYYGDNESMLRDLYELVRIGLPASQRNMLLTRRNGEDIYWQLAQQPSLQLR